MEFGEPHRLFMKASSSKNAGRLHEIFARRLITTKRQAHYDKENVSLFIQDFRRSIPRLGI
jgi:hypothetical protein